MFRNIIRVLLLVLAIKGLCSTSQKSWGYSIISIFSNSSDTNMLDMKLKVITLGRSLYAVSGDIELKVEADDKYYFQINLYRSATGNSQYKLMPLKIDNQTLTAIMNGPYKDYMMDSVRDCSNAPQFKDNWVGPLKPQHFTADKCTIKTDNLPNHMHPGYYKIIAFITGNNFQANVIVVVKLESNFS